MPNSTSQSATRSIVFFVGAKVFATFSADQCFPTIPKHISYFAFKIPISPSK